MTRYILLCAVVLVAACSSAPGSPALAPTAVAGTQMVARADIRTRPHITKISRVVAQQTQRITITGVNFGTAQPYDGDSPYLKMIDVRGYRHDGPAWAAGCVGCGTTLNVTSWTDTEIVIAGFTGTYSENPLKRGDFLVWWVVNPQTNKGAAGHLVKVGGR
jgi:hypothetical protein